MFHVNKRIDSHSAAFGIFCGSQLICEIDVKERGKEMVSIDVYDGFHERVVGWSDIIEDFDEAS